MDRKGEAYQYTESGLDNVYLLSGFSFKGGTVIIHDIEGLQRAIGMALANLRRRLTAKEFRFLRSELLLSQANLAKVLDVKELTIGRWERGESEIPLPTDILVRQLYLESLGEEGRRRIKPLLDKIADLDDEIDRQAKIKLRKPKGQHWNVLDTEAA